MSPLTWVVPFQCNSTRGHVQWRFGQFSTTYFKDWSKERNILLITWGRIKEDITDMGPCQSCNCILVVFFYDLFRYFSTLRTLSLIPGGKRVIYTEGFCVKSFGNIMLLIVSWINLVNSIFILWNSCFSHNRLMPFHFLFCGLLDVMFFIQWVDFFVSLSI